MGARGHRALLEHGPEETYEFARIKGVTHPYSKGFSHFLGEMPVDEVGG